MAELASKTIKIDSEDIKLTPTFGLINDRAVAVLKDNIERAFGEVDFFLGRWVDDAYRRIALPQVMGTVEGALTTEQVARNLAAELRRNGITGFVDRRGRRWRLDTYTIMVARTTTMEAHLIGSARRIAELGQDLVKVSTHLTDCPLCRPFEGMVLSLTGATAGYTTIAEARELGLFHPNCKHGFALYAEALLQEEAEEEAVGEEELEELKRSVNPLLSGLVDERYIKKDFAEFRRQIIEKFNELERVAWRIRNEEDPEVRRLVNEIREMVKQRYGIEMTVKAPHRTLMVDDLDQILDGLFSAMEYFKNSALYNLAKKDGVLPTVELVPEATRNAIAYYEIQRHNVGFFLKSIRQNARLLRENPGLGNFGWWRFYEPDSNYVSLLDHHAVFINSFSVFLHEFGHAIFRATHGPGALINYLTLLVNDLYTKPVEMLRKRYVRPGNEWSEWFERFGSTISYLVQTRSWGHKAWASIYATQVFDGSEYPSTALESFALYLLGKDAMTPRHTPLLILNSAVRWVTKDKVRMFSEREEEELLKRISPNEIASMIAEIAEGRILYEDYSHIYLLFSVANKAGKLRASLEALKRYHADTYSRLVRARSALIEEVEKGPGELSPMAAIAHGYLLAIDEMLKKAKLEW